MVDGAKRDRAIWSGDLVVEGPGIWTTLGAGGAAYVKQSLLALARAADAMVDYFRYTGDRDFARQALPVVEKQLAFIASGLDDRGPLRHHRGRAGPARGGR